MVEGDSWPIKLGINADYMRRCARARAVIVGVICGLLLVLMICSVANGCNGCLAFAMTMLPALALMLFVLLVNVRQYRFSKNRDWLSRQPVLICDGTFLFVSDQRVPLESLNELRPTNEQVLIQRKGTGPWFGDPSGGFGPFRHDGLIDYESVACFVAQVNRRIREQREEEVDKS